MGQCMELLFDGELCIGPALDEGFYYEMFMDEKLAGKLHRNEYCHWVLKTYNYKF